MDFEKELAKFEFTNIDQNMLRQIDEGAILISNFNTTLKRLGIDQSKTNLTLEGLTDALDEIREQNRLADEYQARLAEKAEEQERLIRCVIAVMDQIEDLCHYYENQPADTLFHQIAMMWKQMCGSLAAADLNVIGTNHIPYNSQFHLIEHVQSDPDAPAGIVLEVLQSGYISHSVVIRKAKVIINGFRQEDETGE